MGFDFVNPALLLCILASLLTTHIKLLYGGARYHCALTLSNVVYDSEMFWHHMKKRNQGVQLIRTGAISSYSISVPGCNLGEDKPKKQHGATGKFMRVTLPPLGTHMEPI